jgi:hypothetical protein
VDEWLANLYIEVKKFEVVGFQMHNEFIELQIPLEKPLSKKETSTLEDIYENN